MEEKNTENFSDENKVVRVKLVRHRWPDEIAARRKKQRQIMGTILACALFLPPVSHYLHLFSREIPVCQPVQIK